MERTSAPQPSAADGYPERVRMAALEFRLAETLGARQSRDGVRGRNGVLSPFLGGTRVDDYNTEATDVYSTAATESLLWPFPSPLRSGVSTFPRHSDQTATRPAPQISEERRQTVETARQSWIRKLIDLSRRNNLLYFRLLKTGTLELTSASSERLRDLLVGESVSAAKLLPNLEDDLLVKILRDISRRALENSEEKGLSTLFVTFGMATWPALDWGRPAEAPVLLLPVVIGKKEGSNSYYLSAAGSFQLNLVLLHVLEDQFEVKLQPEELLAEFAGEEEEGTVLDIKGLCGKIQRLMADTRGFEIGL